MLKINLIDQKCVPCEGTEPPLTREASKKLYLELDPEWKFNETYTVISRHFSFKGWNKTMGFINAVAWIIQRESHHPEISVGFNYCTIHLSTHAIKGLSKNDFICAAKIDKLLI